MIYGYVSVWLFCDIVPGQPDAAAAAMKMCLSVIRLFNLSEGTGLSVSLTLANPRPGAHTRPHYMRALLKYFLISEKIFSFLSTALSLPDSPLVGGTEVGKLADWCEVRTLKWV